jgi:hypothetical protein
MYIYKSCILATDSDELQCCVSDINECKINPESCDNETQICESLLGSFKCSCRSGYELEDGISTNDQTISCRRKVSQSRVISIALGKTLIIYFVFAW